MPEYYGGAPTAFQGGMEYGAATRLRQRHENALAALIAQYGPEAADPVAAAQLQQTRYNAEMHPYDVEATQRVAAEQQRIAAAHEAMVKEHGAIAGDPATQARDLELRLSAGRRAAAVLKQVRDTNGDVGKAFDFVQQALPAIGIPPEHLAPLREALAADPDAADQFIAMLGDPEGQKALSGGQPMYDENHKLVWVVPDSHGNPKVWKGLTPAIAAQGEERLRQGADRLLLGRDTFDLNRLKTLIPKTSEGVGYQPGPNFDNDPTDVVAVIVPGSPAEQAFNDNLEKANETDKTFLRAFEATSNHGAVVQTNADRALSYFSDARAGVITQSLRLGTKLIPGTDAYNANDALQAIKNNIGIDELQRMRRSSPTGGAMGNVSDRDMSLLTGALGRLETERDPARLRDDIETIKTVYDKIIEAARKDADDAQYRTQLRMRRKKMQGQPAAPSAAPSTSAPSVSAPEKPKTADEYLKLYGGH